MPPNPKQKGTQRAEHHEPVLAQSSAPKAAVPERLEADHHGPQPSQKRSDRLGCRVGEFNPALLEKLESRAEPRDPVSQPPVQWSRVPIETTADGITFLAQHGATRRGASPLERPAEAAPPPPDRVRAAYERKAYQEAQQGPRATSLCRRMEPPAPLVPQGEGGGGGGPPEADPIKLETEEQGEGGLHSEGELDGILQEQLARLRSSWSRESSWHCCSR